MSDEALKKEARKRRPNFKTLAQAALRAKRRRAAQAALEEAVEPALAEAVEPAREEAEEAVERAHARG